MTAYIYVEKSILRILTVNSVRVLQRKKKLVELEM